MYLLHEADDKIRLQEFTADCIPNYAILSHTWEDEEVSFQDINGPDPTRRKGSAELSEAINSMYRWYEEAEVCYAYLADVPPQSRALSDGELLAPITVIFYDSEWNELGTKDSLKDEIAQRTTIPVDILSGTANLDDMSIAQRMSWAARRQTRRVEDRAYCLLGLFGINMPLLYGEGNMAFIRLQEEIIKILDDYSIFAWKSDQSSNGGLLATTRDAFKYSGDIIPAKGSLLESRNSWMVTN
ncbi:hypothetical protein BDV59DRAFT_209908 [Aspergillus ambiguus]|uniref:uncharacterized protein n=1 Tax=Aspergillus ambiguus TaxID=176160 RepID=UPI003CCD35A9